MSSNRPPRTRSRLKVRLTPRLFQIQIPVLQQFLFDPFTQQVLTAVGLEFHLASSVEVTEVATHCLEVPPSPAENFDHDLRSTTDRATNQLDLVLR
jgi:hypothetical protein